MVARTLDKRFSGLWKTFIGIHFDEVGRAKGEWVVKHTKPGPVAMLLGPAGALVMVEQEKSFRQAIEPAGYKVMFAQNSTQTRENGLKLSEDALVANPDLVAIYASNDDLALGAAEAVKAAGRLGQVAVIGLNGSPAAATAKWRRRCSIDRGDETTVAEPTDEEEPEPCRDSIEWSSKRTMISRPPLRERPRCCAASRSTRYAV